MSQDKLTQVVQKLQKPARIDPYLKTIFFTPGIDTGDESNVTDSVGRINLENTSRQLVADNRVRTWGIPFCLIGDPGTAKSSIIKYNANALGLPCVTSIGSTKDPTDYNGVPTTADIKIDDPCGKIKRYEGGELVYSTGKEPVYVFDDNGKIISTKEFHKSGTHHVALRGEPKHDLDGNLKRKKQVVTVTRTAVPELFVQLAKKKHATFFADELSSCPQSVQAAYHGLVLDRRIGEFALPGTIRIIGAMNKTDIATNGTDIGIPLANRFGWLNVNRISFDDWRDFMLNDGNIAQPIPIDPREEENRVMQAWNLEAAKAKGAVCGFLQATQGQKLLKVPDKNSKDLAWPSPRSWHMATHLLAGTGIHGLTEIQRDRLLIAMVGDGVGGEFITYLRDSSLPDPLDILDGKINFKIEERLDRMYATLTAMTAIVVSPLRTQDPEEVKLKDARTLKLWKVLQSIPKKEIIVPNAKILVEHNLFKYNEIMPFVGQLLPFLEGLN